MNKKSLNDTVFTIQGVNPGFNTRDESNNSSSQPTPGKVVLKRFYLLFMIIWLINISFSYRKQLLACPYLQVDEQIKLLNLQKNCIVKIANLDHLTSLVVLDLCDNEIDCIQGLDNLSSLRILRLANNK
jgi:Leucine-rich repeat (LRR) protein